MLIKQVINILNVIDFIFQLKKEFIFVSSSFSITRLSIEGIIYYIHQDTRRSTDQYLDFTLFQYFAHFIIETTEFIVFSELDISGLNKTQFSFNYTFTKILGYENQQIINTINPKQPNEQQMLNLSKNYNTSTLQSQIDIYSQ
ncbi:Hypothetical_protein [Hexamita inflata]|uniref:Hypothetical_protein n=1 Tax=Hexamita inflata TaxID=28002 RepID=A0AA86Q527_9EUKA|nr:Hypothetical protein HINF_LOCUS38968 [Hexamita inflata]